MSEFARKRVGFAECGVDLRGGGWRRGENFFICKALRNRVEVREIGGKVQNYFGGMEKGCIFASAFDEKATVI